jgi:ABC-2 type transport system ATP-binding protein
MDGDIICADAVSMKFRISSDRIQSIKEFAIAALRRKLNYQDLWALKSVNFTIQKGEVVGIIGSNGAGKSTLLKIISGILKPTLGTIHVRGNVVPMLELGSGFDHDLTGRENIFLNGAILGYSKSFLESKYDEILEFSGLKQFIDTPIRNYSSGMMMRLAFSIATVVHPEILIVDEILSVGDEAFQHKSRMKMKELMSGGTTVLFVSHSLSQIREMCDRVIWLDHGMVKMIGETNEICDAYQSSILNTGD